MNCDKCHERPGEEIVTYCGAKSHLGFDLVKTKTSYWCNNCVKREFFSSIIAFVVLGIIFGSITFFLSSLVSTDSPGSGAILLHAAGGFIFGLITIVIVVQLLKTLWIVLTNRTSLAPQHAKIVLENDKDYKDLVLLTAEEFAKAKINVRIVHTKPAIPQVCVHCAKPIIQENNHKYFDEKNQRTFNVHFNNKVYEAGKEQGSFLTESKMQVAYSASAFDCQFLLCDSCNGLDKYDFRSDVMYKTENVNIRSARNSNATFHTGTVYNYIEWAFKNHDYAEQFKSLNRSILFNK